jgi:hypothetical protein
VFKTKEIAALVELDVITINNWVHQGHIEPAVMGRSGKGQSHRWNYGQALGFAIVAPIYRSERSCTMTYLSRVMARFKAMKSQLVRGWIGDGVFHSEAHGDEAMAEFLPPSLFRAGWPEKQCQCDECKRARDDVDRQEIHRLERKVSAAIRAKLGIASPVEDQLTNRISVLEAKKLAAAK